MSSASKVLYINFLKTELFDTPVGIWELENGIIKYPLDKKTIIYFDINMIHQVVKIEDIGLKTVFELVFNDGFKITASATTNIFVFLFEQQYRSSKQKFKVQKLKIKERISFLQIIFIIPVVTIILSVLMSAVKSNDVNQSKSPTSNSESENSSGSSESNKKTNIEVLKKTANVNARLFNIPNACSVLDKKLNGYKPTPYKPSYDGDTEYMCGTPYKQLPNNDNSPGINNNIAYYASGSKNKASELNLTLYVNQPSNEKSAKDELKSASKILILSFYPKFEFSKISNCIAMSKDCAWDINGYKVTLSKTIWPNKNGYQFDFTINSKT